MANKKVATKSAEKVKEVKDTKTVDEVKEVKVEEKSKESEEVKALKQQLEEMKKAMELLAAQSTQPQQQVIVKKEEDEVVIGCRMLQGVGWGDPGDPSGEIRLEFNEEQSVTVSDMKRFFRQASIRRLFVDGICYFAEPENYKLFNIREYTDLSNDMLVSILTEEDINNIVRKLDKITEAKKNSRIVNCLIYRICDMIRNNELQWDYYTRKAVEDYFGMEFDRGISTLRAIDALRVR